MTIPVFLRRLRADPGADPDRRSVDAYVRLLDELRSMLASDLAKHRIERGHA